MDWRGWADRILRLIRGRRAWWAILGRPWIGVALILACNLPGLKLISDVPLQHDPDTGGILQEIRRDTSASGLASWFARDWPLGNKFYRPLVVLSLAADNALYGDWARGYRMTSWLLSVLTALAVYWWLSVLSSRRAFGMAGGVVFSLRQAGVMLLRPGLLAFVLVIVAFSWLALAWDAQRRRPERQSAAGEFRRDSWAFILAASVVVAELEWRLNGIVVTWIAARTALLGTLFSTVCFACFARLMRTGKWADGVLVFLSAATALLSYEQSLALPVACAALFLFAPRRRKTAGYIGLGAVSLAAVGYVLLRLHLIGPTASAYQFMQLKTSAFGAISELGRYVFPPYYLVAGVWDRAAVRTWWVLAERLLWQFVILSLLWVAVYLRLFLLVPRAAASLWLMKTVLFLPMAALHVFDHYYYLPETAAAGLAVALIWPNGAGPSSAAEATDPQ